MEHINASGSVVGPIGAICSEQSNSNVNSCLRNKLCMQFYICLPYPYFQSMTKHVNIIETDEV